MTWVRVAEATASSDTAVDFDNVFTTGYDVYRVTHTLSFTSDTSLLAQMRASASTNTSGDYEAQRHDKVDTVSSYLRQTARTSFIVGGIRTNQLEVNDCLIYYPALTEFTSVYEYRSIQDDMQRAVEYINNTTAYDGIRFLVTSGTMTGSIRIHGLRES